MTNGLTRGIPVQDLPENQDESVRYSTDQVTGIVTPFEDRETGSEVSEADKDEAPKPTPPKGRRKRRNAAGEDTGPDDAEVHGDDADDEGAPAELASDPTSLREVGS